MLSSRNSRLHGFLVVDKPAGWTSHDVVARVRRLTNTKRVGHAGTLDPFATGVLVVAVGKTTRLLQYSQLDPKRYLAHIVLGAESDSADIDGELLSRTTPASWPDRAAIEQTVSKYTGQIEQIPPALSAIRVGGERLYKRVRAGEHVQAPPRAVLIHEITVTDYVPPDLIIAVSCGSGTYIRSLARDIGQSLGVGGYCHALRRIGAGSFSADDAWSIDELRAIDLPDHWPTVALHPDAGLCRYSAVILSETESRSWYHGSPVSPDDLQARPNAKMRIYGSSGDFLGLGEVDSHGSVRPLVVFIVDSEGDGS